LETVDQIWAGDLFNRRREAEDLIDYLESVVGRPSIREDGHAHVMAIDTAYGRGKTFFLGRLDRHLKSTDHVSAYIDAWVDDLEDQPLVALAATLDQALQPWVEKSDKISGSLNDFKDKAGKVAKIVGVGLAKRGMEFLITRGAAEALSDELSGAGEDVRDITREALKGAGKGAVDDAATALRPAANLSMEIRIKRFREGQAAIKSMKSSLSEVVDALADAGMKLPIVIIVDELDRCRPTYAIKVLEEIKHLFDVSGVSFLLGLHGRQLEQSVSAAYGNNFNGAAYLRRFFNKKYSLKAVSLQPLVQNLISQLGIDESLLMHPKIVQRGTNRSVFLSSAEIISDYLRAYELEARDAFAIMESLHTAVALVRGAKVQLLYLMPLIISRYLGKDGLFAPIHSPWDISLGNEFSDEVNKYRMIGFVEQLHEVAKLNDAELSKRFNNNDIHAQVIVNQGFRNASESYHLLQNYPALVDALARFS